MPLFKWGKSGNATMSKAEAKAKLEHKLMHAKETPEPIFDLADCGLKEVPHGVYMWCKVCLKEALLLQGNQLASLDGGGNLKDLSLLQVLDLHDNGLKQLPEDIGRLTSLQILYLSGNYLQSLPKTFVQLKKLETLTMQGNKFREVPEVLCGLTRLRTLDISNNLVRKLPLTFAHLRTLDTLILDHADMSYPTADICASGTEAIMKFLCKECQIDYVPPSQAISMADKVDGSTPTSPTSTYSEKDMQDYWTNIENQKAQKRKERMEVERQLQEQQINQAIVVASTHLKRLQLLEDVSKGQSLLEKELLEAQLKKDGARQSLISELVKVEQLSNKFITELLALTGRTGNVEAILEAEKHEREEFEELFLKKQAEAQDLRRKDVLNAMMQSLQEGERFKHYSDDKVELLHRVQAETDAAATTLLDVLSKKTNEQEQMVSRVFKEEQFQKEALISLMNKKDGEYIRVRDQVCLIQDELAKLTLLELKQRDLKMDFQVSVLAEKREILTQLLTQLMEQQKLRREEMKRRLDELESQRASNQDDFWLLQYQRMMDHKPPSLQTLEDEMDPDVKNLLNRAGVYEYIPLFAKKKITMVGLCALGRDGFREIGIHNRLAIFAIVSTLEEMQEEQRRLASKIAEIHSEAAAKVVTPSAPPETGPFEMDAHMEIECVVCMEKKCCMLFLNCGHVCCCEKCGPQIKTCPMCRGDVLNSIRLHFPE